MNTITINGKEYVLALKMRGLKYLETQGISMKDLGNLGNSPNMMTQMCHIAYAVLMGNEGMSMDFIDDLDLSEVQEIVSRAFADMGNDLTTSEVGKSKAKA